MRPVRAAGLLCSFLLFPAAAFAQEFVTRRGDTLWTGGRPFLFAGANAYPLMVLAARGDTTGVRNLFTQAGSLGLTVLRTWAFHDSGDSLGRTVLQFAPGRYNENAFRALDFVVDEARRSGIRLILPLVNNWDNYGGMNQYVRWRMGNAGGSAPGTTQKTGGEVSGPGGRRYELELGQGFGHDDFYRDPVIRGWFRSHIAEVTGRVNSRTGIAYREEPAILAWELANEPRSSDPSGILVRDWVEEMARFLKQHDPRHLIGTGEEGCDVAPPPGGSVSYGGAAWVYDGTAGVSFNANTAVPEVDFAGAHLYPEAWGMPVNAGTQWIRDHLRTASLHRKPFILGEFGARRDRAAVYDSWLTMMVLDGAVGACVWHLAASGFDDGYGIRCKDSEDPACAVLAAAARQFDERSRTGRPPAPFRTELLQSFPNPFTSLATVMYTLRQDSDVTLELYSLLGQRVATLVQGVQSAGTRRELVEGRGLPSGAYVYRLTVVPLFGGPAEEQSGKCVVVR